MLVRPVYRRNQDLASQTALATKSVAEGSLWRSARRATVTGAAWLMARWMKKPTSARRLLDGSSSGRDDGAGKMVNVQVSRDALKDAAES